MSESPHKCIYELIKSAHFGHEPDTEIITITIECANREYADALRTHFADTIDKGESINLWIHPPPEKGKA